jgi:ATPase subunit of ABC transporter with duplicated ATPase domains
VEALSDALSVWGDAKGAIIVVSHDRHFCDKITFTHVATVRDGKFVLEEREVRPSDWIVSGMSAATAVTSGIEASSQEGTKSDRSATSASQTKELDPKLRKAAYNAPKRIKKLEGMIAESEGQIAELDEWMLQNGKDVEKLLEWNQKKQKLQEKIDSYMLEWNELEDVLAKVAEVT